MHYISRSLKETMKPFLLLFVSLLTATFSHAASYRFFNTDDIGARKVFAVTSDRSGFIWIGTDYGLRRFDGTRFKPYTHAEGDSTSLNENTVRKILVNDDGLIWIATADGLHLHSPLTDSFRLVKLPGLGFHGYILDMVSDGKDGIWFIVANIGLYHVTSTELTASCVDTLNISRLNNVRMIIRDNNGALWMCAENEDKIIRLSTADYTITDYNIPVKGISAIMPDRDMTPTVISGGHVYKYDNYRDSFVMDRAGINSLSLDKDYDFGDNNPMLYDSGRIISFDADNHVMHVNPFSDNKNLNGPDLQISAVYTDSRANIWIGILNHGLILVRPNDTPFSFINYRHFNSRHNSTAIVTACTPGNNDVVWIAFSDKKILAISKSGTSSPIIHTSGIPTAIIALGDEILIAWEKGVGLCEYHIKSLSKKILFHASHDNVCNSIVFDGDYNIYAGINGLGILKYTGESKDTEWFTDRNSGLVNNWISTLYASNDTTIIIGHSGGVSIMDTHDNTIRPLTDSPEINKIICHSITVDRDNCIWIGSNRGLIEYSTNGKIVKHTSSDGLSDDIVCFVTTDSIGNIWCSNALGLNKLDIKSHTITSFFGGNGLKDKIYERGIGATTSDGTICLAGAQGFTTFNPADVIYGTFDGKVILSDLYIKGHIVSPATRSGSSYILDRPVNDADIIRLSHDDNTLSLLLSVSNYHESDNIAYEYKMSEKDKDWNRLPQGESVLRYHHLNPGSYTLHIRAFENGSYSPVRTINIEVRHPWYTSAIARMVYLAILIAIGYFTFQYMRRKRRHEIDEAKLEYFINISHEIRSPLSLIIGPIETLMYQIKDPGARGLINTMHINATRIKNLINQILDIRKIDTGHFSLRYTQTELVAYSASLIEMFAFQADKNNIKLLMTSSEDSILAWIDINNMDKVLINLIGNAFKFTKPGGEICLDISTDDEKNDNTVKHCIEGYVRITISDTGKGLNPTDIDRIFDRFYQTNDVNTDLSEKGFGIGLNLCKKIVELHHGRIIAENRNDKPGSIFTILLPRGNTHLSQSEISLDTDVRRDIAIMNPPASDILLIENTKKVRSKINHTILIIDDDPDITDYLKRQLSDKYKIITADNGAKGLEIIAIDMPDLIISDVIMPHMDGIELIKRIRANVNTCHIPVILLSTRSQIEDKIAGMSCGADYYIGKPFVLSELKTVIRNLIDNRQRLKGLYTVTQDKIEDVTPITLKSNDDVLIERMINIVNTNIANQDFNVETLCGEMGISRTHLHRKMKEIMGITASDFIRNVKLRQACELLKNDDIDIAQIAYAVGFSNSAHFATTFKKHYGVSPSDYRLINRQKYTDSSGMQKQ